MGCVQGQGRRPAEKEICFCYQLPEERLESVNNPSEKVFPPLMTKGKRAKRKVEETWLGNWLSVSAISLSQCVCVCVCMFLFV